jgi:hypothetical protein
MNLAEKIFALHAVFPFSELKAKELLVAANAFSARSFPPGHIICPVGETMNRLYVRTSGALVDPQGTIMHPVVGTTCLLVGQPTPFTIISGPSGYEGLLLQRGKFFTLINECPSLLLGFFQMPLLGLDYKAPLRTKS